MTAPAKGRYSLLFIFNAIVIATIVLVLGARAGIDYFSQRQQIIEAMHQRSEQSLTRLGNNIAPFIEAFAPEEYSKLIETEIRLNRFRAIVVHDFNLGKTLGRNAYISGKTLNDQLQIEDFNPDNPAHRQTIEAMFFSDTASIQSADGTRIGSITIYISDVELRQQLNQMLINSILDTLIITTLLIVLLGLLFHRLLVTPLRLIQTSLSQQDADGIPLNPPPASPFVELSALIDTLQNMLRIIRRSRDNLIRQHTQLTNVISGANAGTWEWNIQTGELIINERWATMIGYELDELTPATFLTWKERLHPDDLQRGLPLLEQHFAKALPEFRLEFRMRHKQGHWVWILGIGRVSTWAEDGKPLLMSGTHLDISDKKAQEAELITQRRRLNDILIGTHAGTWEWNVQTGEVIFNERWAEIVGYTLAELAPVSINTWSSLAHPDDLAQSEVLLNKHFAGELPFYEVECRMRHKQGHWVWVLDRGKVASWTDDGKPLLMSGTHQDITTRKQTEEQLVQADIVYRSSSEGIMVCDAENRILAVNPAFTTLTGYTAEEIIGTHPSILKSGRQSPDFYHALWDTLNRTGQWKGEMWNRKKSGEQYAEAITINTVYDTAGKVHRRIAVFSDITEKKKAEELMWTQANYDFLTGLPNRRLFIDRVEHEIRKAARNQSRLALFFIDLDRFKEVNDSLGHEAGDDLLREAARRIQFAVRSSDTVGRLGGDEFTALLSDIRELTAPEKIARNILESLKQPFQLNNKQVFIGGSIGITLYPDDAQSLDDLFRFADKAMYVSKQSGRGCFHFYASTSPDSSEK